MEIRVVHVVRMRLHVTDVHFIVVGIIIGNVMKNINVNVHSDINYDTKSSMCEFLNHNFRTLQ